MVDVPNVLSSTWLALHPLGTPVVRLAAGVLYFTLWLACRLIFSSTERSFNTVVPGGSISTIPNCVALTSLW